VVDQIDHRQRLLWSPICHRRRVYEQVSLLARVPLLCPRPSGLHRVVALVSVGRPGRPQHFAELSLTLACSWSRPSTRSSSQSTHGPVRLLSLWLQQSTYENSTVSAAVGNIRGELRGRAGPAKKKKLKLVCSLPSSFFSLLFFSALLPH
jgi:hypothetical protein